MGEDPQAVDSVLPCPFVSVADEELQPGVPGSQGIIEQGPQGGQVPVEVPLKPVLAARTAACFKTDLRVGTGSLPESSSHDSHFQ
jgi:hypothetical protein